MLVDVLISSFSKRFSGNISTGSVTVIAPETSMPPSSSTLARSLPSSLGAIPAVTSPLPEILIASFSPCRARKVIEP